MVGDVAAFRFGLFCMEKYNLLESGEYLLIYVSPSLDYNNPYDAMLHQFFGS